jgi:hypothetical protein
MKSIREIPDNQLIEGLFFGWCEEGDLNPHALRHTPLKRTCLPIPPSPRTESQSLKSETEGLSERFFLDFTCEVNTQR